MAYIGRQLTSGNYLKLDDISSQFNGTTTTFNLTSGGQPFYPGSPYSLLVSLGGVIQEPVTSYDINQNQIVFTVAPLGTDNFFCIVLGVSLGIGVPGDRTVTGEKLSGPFNYDSGLLYLDSTNDRVGVGTTNPTHKLHVIGDARVTGILTVGTGSVTIDGTNNSINVGTGVTISSTGINAPGIGLTVASINNGPLAGNRNKIINGDMIIAQRGTSFVSPASGAYNLDRFVWFATGAMVVTITQSTDVPNDTFQNSLKVDVTTADTSTAAGDFAIINQRIEGYNVRDLIGQTFTLSFWVKSPKTGIHCASFINSGLNRSYVLEYTVITANTWEYKTVTVVGGLITGGTWNWTNGIGLNVVFSLNGGTTFQTTPGSWQVGDFQCTSNQVNVMDNVANDFFLTGVQLEVGTVATPFERRPYGTELALCQRYYQLNKTSQGAMNELNNAFVCPVGFTVDMRATPNVSIRSGGNAIHRPAIAFYNATSITETSTSNYLTITISSNYGANVAGQLLPGAVQYSSEL